MVETVNEDLQGVREPTVGSNYLLDHAEREGTLRRYLRVHELNEMPPFQMHDGRVKVWRYSQRYNSETNEQTDVYELILVPARANMIAEHMSYGNLFWDPEVGPERQPEPEPAQDPDPPPASEAQEGEVEASAEPTSEFHSVPVGDDEGREAVSEGEAVEGSED